VRKPWKFCKPQGFQNHPGTEAVADDFYDPARQEIVNSKLTSESMSYFGLCRFGWLPNGFACPAPFHPHSRLIKSGHLHRMVRLKRIVDW